MIIVIILIVLAGVVYLIMNSLAQNTTNTTPYINTNIINIPQTTTPFVNRIPNLLLIKGNIDLFYTLNKMTSNVDSESRTISNLTWNKDMNNIVNSVDNDENRLAAQFRFFAEFWLNKLNLNSGFTNVYDLTGNIGRYEFRRNNSVYTGKFNGVEWSWDTVDYCFNTVNSKIQNKCLGRWFYNQNNGKCYPPLNSTSTCDNYEHKIMQNYINQTDVNSWMTKCNVSNSINCVLPNSEQLTLRPTQTPTLRPTQTPTQTPTLRPTQTLIPTPTPTQTLKPIISMLFTKNMDYNMPMDVDNLKIFMIGGGGSGYGSHSGAGGAGFITTVNAGKITKGTIIKVNIGAGGERGRGTRQPLSANNGQDTTITILGDTYTADGGLSAINANAPGGAGSSGGGGAGNPGPGGDGGSGGSNGVNGAFYIGGNGMGTSAFKNAINFIGNSIYNFRAGLGGASGDSTHSGGGGAGGIICDNINYPVAENGGNITSGKGGIGFGAGGGSGGHNYDTHYYGGAGASGMAYIFV